MIYLTWVYLISALISAQCAEKNYGPALDKAKDAALIQSGAQAEMDKLKAYVETRAKNTASDLGVDKELGVVFFGFKVYRDKALSCPLTKDTPLTVQTDRVQLKINF